jgi:hypothetical protein
MYGALLFLHLLWLMSFVSGFSSRLVLFVFAHYYVISLHISSLLFSCHLLVYVRVCMYFKLFGEWVG